MKTFIRVVECWTPSGDRSLLEFGGGVYGAHTAFGAISRAMCFGRGEGLPGAAWEAGHPIVLRELEGSAFRRVAAARAEGLTCGIAVPIFAGDFLTAVVVIFCGDDEAHAGAIELWGNDPAHSKDMTLVDGYYGNTAEAFEFLSRRTSFRRGHGLPGAAWESGMPVFLDDLGRGGGFLRADSAVKVGINRGFAMPCSTRGPGSYVMTFLSALATPIARRVEIWRPQAGSDRLQRCAGFCEVLGSLDGRASELTIDADQATVGRPALTGIPAFCESADSEPGGIGASAAQAGLHSLVALPVLHAGRLVATVAWYF
jgi:hypothetical protein